MSKIIVSGSIAYDRIMDFPGNFTDHIVPDKLHALSVSFQVERVTENFGGCAGNIAYNLALLGEEPTIIGTVGSDFGRYREHLIQNNIDVSSIHMYPEDLTSAAHMVTDRANNQIAAFAMAAGARPYGALPDTREYRCVILAAGCVQDTEALAAHARKNNLAYYVDPGQSLTTLTDAALKEIISGAAGVFGNDYEFALIKQKTGWGEKELLEKTPLVVVTLGAKGSRIVTKEGVIEIPAAPIVKLVDPTGAGDAHRAGFVKGVVAGLPLKGCGQLASTVAAYAIEKQGTQNHRFTMDELKDRYKSAYGETLRL